jgi:hypothetical protein
MKINTEQVWNYRSLKLGARGLEVRAKNLELEARTIKKLEARNKKPETWS